MHASESNGGASNGEETTTPVVVSTAMSEFVLVADSEEADAERMELPTTAADNALSLKTLEHAFPGAIGLKYKFAATGATRGLMIDASGDKFFPPSEGWSDTTYLVIYNKTAAGGKRKANESLKEEDLRDQKRSNTNARGERKPTDLIVLGMPYKTTEEELKEHFEQFGSIVMAQVKKNHITGDSKGFGFIRFSDYEAQAKALAKTDHVIDGRSVQVNVSRPQGSGGHQGTKIFVARMSEDIKEEDLREVFDAEAKEIDSDSRVTDVFIPKPFRAFGFVSFSDPWVTEEVLKKQTYVVHSTSIVVSPAAPRDQLVKVHEPHQEGGAAGGASYPPHYPSPQQMAAAAAAAAGFYPPAVPGSPYGAHAAAGGYAGRGFYPPAARGAGRGGRGRGAAAPGGDEVAAAWARYAAKYGAMPPGGYY